jgi:hypothetical protein
LGFVGRFYIRGPSEHAVLLEKSFIANDINGLAATLDLKQIVFADDQIFPETAR